MSDNQFDLFISYAHKDNEGPYAGHVSALKIWIENEYRRVTSRALRVFFDIEDIRTMDDWALRIVTGLRQSRVMLAVLSPSYFASAYCRKEWEEYLDQELAHALPGEGIAPIYVLKHPAFEDYDSTSQLDTWMQNLRRRQFVNCLNWWPEGQRALEQEGVRQQLAAVNQQIVERLDRAARRDSSPTNLPRYNKRFVGRVEELHAIRDALVRGKFGAITAVNGIGGIGKSALALVYGYAFGHEYAGGRFWINAAGQDDLRSAIVSLAPKKGVELSPQELTRPEYAFEKVRAAFEAGPPALLMLDNVDDPELLNPARRDDYLPTGDHIHILATTRIDPQELHEVGCIPLDALPTEVALDLLSRYRAIPESPQDAEWKAAVDLVNRLGGHALAVEVVAVYLSRHPEISYGEYLATLVRDGITLVEASGADRKVQLSRHPERSISRLLAPTLDSLTPIERAVVEFAALLPPDHVPLPWIRELVAKAFTDQEGAPNSTITSDNPWSELVRYLDGLRLLVLVQTEDMSLARMHRVVQAVASDQMEPAHRAECQSACTSFAFEKAQQLFFTHDRREYEWQVPSLTGIAERLIQTGDSRGFLFLDGVNESLQQRGDLPAAERLWSKCVAMLQGRHTAEPDNQQVVRDLATALQRLGDLLNVAGDMVRAKTNYDKSVEACVQLLERQPDNHRCADLLSAGYQRQAHALQHLGQLERAVECCRKGVDIERRRIAETSAGADPGDGMWSALFKLGELQLLLGDGSGATQSSLEATDFIAGLAKCYPRNLTYCLALVRSFSRLADLCMATGETAQAAKYLEQAAGMAQHLSELAPGNTDYRCELVVQMNKYGDVCQAQGKLQVALNAYQRAESISRQLVEQVPDNSVYAVDLAGCCDRLGALFMAAGQPQGALPYFQEELDTMRRVAAQDPEDVSRRRGIAVAFNKLGDVYAAVGDVDEALTSYNQSLEIYRFLSAKSPDNVQFARDVAFTLTRLGYLHRTMFLHERSVEYYEQGQAITRRLALVSPDNVDAQRDLAVSYQRLADVFRDLKQPGRALPLYESQLKITEAMAAKSPENANFARDVWVSYWRVAKLLDDVGDDHGAEQWWRRAHDSLNQMIERGLHVATDDRRFLQQMKSRLGQT